MTSCLCSSVPKRSPSSISSATWMGIVTLILTFALCICDALLAQEALPTEGVHSRQSTRTQCDNKTLTECWGQMPEFPEQGIPSSPEALDAACQAFNNGMSCVDKLTKRCLTEENRVKLMNSVRGAHEAYTFLCQDKKFRQEFLQHSNCYKKVSPHWDDCANKFINTLKSLSPVHFDNPGNLCCIRRNFKRCVSEVSHYYCSRDASLFLNRLAEVLVRNAMRGSTTQPEKCDMKNMINECDRRNVGDSVGSQSFISILVVSAVTVTFLKYFHTVGLACS